MFCPYGFRHELPVEANCVRPLLPGSGNTRAGAAICWADTPRLLFFVGM